MNCNWFYFIGIKQELKDNLYYIKVDLCSEKIILDAFEWLKIILKSIDVLINKAGVVKLTNLFGKFKLILLICTYILYEMHT